MPLTDADQPAALSLSPQEADHRQLASLLSQQRVTWHRAGALAAALPILQQERIAVVICAAELPPHSWRDLMEAVQALSPPPLVIITSRLADERLWAEALNLGAHDVLAKPFEPTEVCRVVGQALERRRPRAAQAWRH